VTGHLDKGLGITQWNTRGKMVADWGASHRVQDLALSPDASRLVAMDDKTTVYVYNFVTRDLEYTMEMPGKMGSVNITQNSRYLLVNTLDGEARLIDLETRETLRKFQAHSPKVSSWIIRATLGGANESFVATGSESEYSLLIISESNLIIVDGHIYIWHKEYGQLVEDIEGHKSSCNSVSWNPTNPQMFASAGDDNSVRMYLYPLLFTDELLTL